MSTFDFDRPVPWEPGPPSAMPQHVDPRLAAHRPAEFAVTAQGPAAGSFAPTPHAGAGSPAPDNESHYAPPPQPEEWRLDAANGSMVPRSALDVLTNLNDRVSSGRVSEYQPVPLGFTPLDKTIGGGLRNGELMLIGGAQGTGKTTMALQMARNVVLGGQANVLYICFEHDEEYLLCRLVAAESMLSSMPSRTNAVKITDVRKEILGTWVSDGTGLVQLANNPRLRPSLERIARYGSSLFLMRGSQTAGSVDNLRTLVEKHKELSGGRRLVVFVDYLQKVPVIPEPSTESEKVTTIVNGLKDIALSQNVPLISIAAADKDGLKASRLRNYHLRGSSAINYEADVILILNEKYNIVAKVNIEFNPYQAQRFRDWVIVSVEKNRAGQDAIDLEFEKHFEFSCFDPGGRTVQEKLIEERLYND
ncbi:MAG: AAA family ATPase [Chloroflexi bacterium]|nr:AAA family ATPase [Chloroflexota bacterium]